MYQIAHLPASISRCLQSVADRRGDDVSEKHVPYFMFLKCVAALNFKITLFFS